jgi:ATP-dependent Clp protease ATP-binding subunit ClpC
LDLSPRRVTRDSARCRPFGLVSQLVGTAKEAMAGATASEPALPLAPGARVLLAMGRERQRAHGQDGLHGWLLAVLERHGPLVAAISPGTDVEALRQRLAAAVGQGNDGPPLAEVDLVERAARHAASRGRAIVSEIDIAAVLLTVFGERVTPAQALGKLRRTADGPPPSSAPASSAAAAPEPAVPSTVAWQARATDPTPVLDRFGRDLTRQAAAGELVALVGRERELERIIETLCRRQKRNPILLGAAGTGKTAIVEGLALRIVHGAVPATLRGVRIVQLQPSSLVAGAGIVGEIETRLKGILEEARQDGIVLFIDEVHAIVGTGGMRGTGDLASLLKPALARGEIACIAATTDDEYRRFIEDDAALERRFNPVVIDELDRAATLAVLGAHRDDLRRLRSIDVDDAVLRWLVDFAAEALPNRRFPDKAVDLLEQCVASAVVAGRESVDRPAAEDVARRMAGVPLGIAERLATLEHELLARALADEGSAGAIVRRLGITMRGLDRRMHRANAILVTAGPAVDRVRELAETMAATLFGSQDRVVTLDLGRMTSPHDVAMLVGAPPGYVGYSDRLPIHRIAATPWSVVVCQGVESAHPDIRDVLAEALEDGIFVDGSGRRIALADTIVVLTAGTVETARPLGFRAAPAASEASGPTPAGEPAPAVRAARPDLQRQLGPRLAALVDVVLAEAPAVADSGAARVLADLTARFAQAGLALEFGPAMTAWLVDRTGPSGDLEAVADRDLLPLLAGLLDDRAAAPRTVVVEPGPEGRPVVRPSESTATAPVTRARS